MTFTERSASINWGRKIWHMTGGLFAIGVAYFVPWPYSFYVALGSFLIWVSIESMRRREPWFGRLFFSLSAPFIRGFERRKIVGNTWLTLSVTIIAAIFHDPVLIAGSVVGWTFGDPAAEIIGKLVPSKAYFGGEKTLAGTLGCFVVSALAFAGFFWATHVGGDILPAALTVAAATTLGETFSTSFTVNDNFMIPLTSALALSFILI
jgi:dolichol kinase